MRFVTESIIVPYSSLQIIYFRYTAFHVSYTQHHKLAISHQRRGAEYQMMGRPSETSSEEKGLLV